MALENGMDVKTLSTTIGHVSSETTIDIYSHVTDTMQRQAAAKIDRQIGGTEAEIPRAEEQVKVDTLTPDFEPYKPKCRKSGTGCVTMITTTYLKEDTRLPMHMENVNPITYTPKHARSARKNSQL